jgi:DNA-binding response OmpR family regulator
MKSRILVVEDDARTADSVALYLRHAGYEVRVVADGRAALDAAEADRPALVVLDVMLPAVDGIEVCRALRDRMNAAIIMLTARSTERDKLRGLDAGADDYVTKPFSPRELVARVAAVLRRAGQSGRVLRAGDVEIDVAARAVRRGGSSIGLTPTEFRLLEALASAPGRAFTRRELAERAFGEDSDALDRTIDAHVMNLRRKLDPRRTGAPLIVTVFGTGYRLQGRGDGD